MATVDLRDWRRILTPCPATPEPIASYVFFVSSLSETKAKIIEVLDKYNIPHVAFPDDDHLITCRMRFIFDRSDNTVMFQLDPDHVRIDLSQNPMQVLDSMNKKAMEVIEVAIKLLREMGLVNVENETRVRESMIRSWSEWIEVPKAILPILLGKLAR
jgi:DNA-binding transcriptional ArsR family regulator